MNFSTKKNSSPWRIYVAHGRIHVVLHLTCLNVILNTLLSCGNVCISGFRCRPSVTTNTCYKYIQSPLLMPLPESVLFSLLEIVLMPLLESVLFSLLEIVLIPLVASVLIPLLEIVLIPLVASVLISLLEIVLIPLVASVFVPDLLVSVGLRVVPVMLVVIAEGSGHGRPGITGWFSLFKKLQENSNAPIRWPAFSHILLVCMNSWASKANDVGTTMATEDKTKTTVH